MGRAGEGIFQTPNGRWMARYRDVNHKQRSKTFDTKRDAKLWKAEQERMVDTGSWLNPDARKQTIDTFIPVWRQNLQTRGRKPSTNSMYEEVLRNRVLPYWGGKPIGSITVDKINVWTAEAAMSRSRTDKMHLILRQILDVAVQAKAIQQNPMKITKAVKPQKVRQDPRAFTQAEAKKLISAMPERYKLLTEFLCLTGLRIGEVISLRVGDLNYGEKMIHVRHSTAVVDRVLIESTPKSHKVRTVPLTPGLMKKVEAAVQGKNKGDFVFPGESGGQLHPDLYRNAFTTATRSIDRPDMTPHTLRDTFASWSISAGVPITAIAKSLGHADPSITLKFYAAFFPADFDVLRNELAKIKL
jgi:integrase